MTSNLELFKRPFLLRLAMVPAMLMALPLQVLAAQTDIADAPFTVEGGSPAKPNVMFILDDSGSMARTHMPDSVGDDFTGNYGYVSAQCNGVYFDPTITYSPPKKSDGSSYPDVSFTAAPYDGYDLSAFDPDNSNTVINLSTKFKAWDTKTGSSGKDTEQKAYYYTYSGTQTVKDYENNINHPKKGKKSTTNGVDFFEECNSSFGASPGNAVFTKVDVTVGTAAEKQNFANWFSYYRTRMLTMKSGAGAAFSTLDDSMRIGFTTINNTGANPADPEYLDIADFDQTQKDAWYAKFYAVKPSNTTPLRQALSKTGRIYAGKLGADPLQYWCQRNYAILSTDGFWNENDSKAVKINGTSTVGNQDGGTTPAPFWEGSTSTSNTLADVAAYYYSTDLRSGPLGCLSPTGDDLCQNNLAPKGKDTASHQHMTTYTVGLGVSGSLRYQADYETASSGDYYDITQKTKQWPKPVSNDLTTVDDLWHAAVNGRGSYYSALNPAELSNGLSKALISLQVVQGAGAAASTSNLEPVLDDNKAFTAEYRTVFWDGDIQARTIDLDTGELSASALWSAKNQLNALVGDVTDSRKIYTFDASTPTKLKNFLPGSFTAAEKSAWFDPSGLTQYGALDATQKANATPDNLINYLRGQFGYEMQTAAPAVPIAQQVFRDREVVLGDIISARPVHVRVPPFAYDDPGFAAHKSSPAIKNRKGVVYVGANDGMMHAFEADTGAELWAYVPSFVLPNMAALADKTYATNHRYYVDGSPTAAEIYDGSKWKTILVGGLGGGGRGYYALDVTDPDKPEALWEFSDANLGLTFGNPLVAKLANGTWAVLFGSGYNNGDLQANGDANVPPGDGVGRLFIVDAGSGAKLHEIATTEGTPGTPSGLAKISGWVNKGLTDNTIERVYGGDLLGNMWRVDLSAAIAPAAYAAFKLGNFNVGGVPQPITVRPDLGEIIDTVTGGAHSVAFFGTGRLLGTTDPSDPGQLLTAQSIYAIKDKIGGPSLGDARLGGACALVKQDVLVQSSSTRTTTANPVNWNTQCGWYLDLNPGNQSPGERVNVDVKLQVGVLAVAANVPTKDVCLAGGPSWLYLLDYRTGSFVETDSTQTAGQLLGNALAVGISTYRLPNGKVVTNTTLANNDRPTTGNPSTGAGAGGGKRVSWRELFNR